MILQDVLGPFGLIGGLLVIGAAVYVAVDNGDTRRPAAHKAEE
jgi:hypothetical protein